VHKPRYIVVNCEGEWLIRQAGRHFSDSYSTKMQALRAAITFAEKDGEAGLPAAVVVQEDEHFKTEWIYGEGSPSKEATRSCLTPPLKA